LGLRVGSRYDQEFLFPILPFLDIGIAFGEIVQKFFSTFSFSAFTRSSSVNVEIPTEPGKRAESNFQLSLYNSFSFSQPDLVEFSIQQKFGNFESAYK